MTEKKKILVIEEDVNLIKLLADDLADFYNGVETASNWIEAVALLREFKFELVIVDVEIEEEFNLLQAINFIHSIDLDYRILPIFKSAEQIVQLQDVLMRSAITGVLVKPWKKEQLVNVVIDILDL